MTDSAEETGKNLPLSNGEDRANSPDVFDADEFPTSVKRSGKILEELTMSVMRGEVRGGFDLSTLSEPQKDKVLELMQKNDENAYTYSRERLKTMENLNTKALDASIVNQKTFRYIAVGIIAVIFILLTLILFLKDEYFTTFLSFIMGVGSGLGIRDIGSKFMKMPKSVTSETESESAND
ncbi:MAG: hypothetical protein LBQ39_02000 [Tannerellaceae bacterium]|jgi:hypothetical protein|nr:hypothetical protein [Tannerellaceae bacterium]